MVRHHICDHPGDVVGYSSYGCFVVMESMITWLLLVSLVVFVALVDYLLQGCRDELASPGLHGFGERVLPDPMKLLRQRTRHPQTTFKRLYHLR